MTDAERKAVGYIVRQAVALTAATMGDKPIYSNRRHLAEDIGQRVDAQMALFGVEGALAEWVTAANQPKP